MNKFSLIFWSFFILAVLFMPLPAAFAQDEQCGYCPPMWCTLESSEAQRLKEKKKDWLRSRGLPERYVALYDGLDNCRKCIEFSSDWPSIILVPSAEGWEEAGGEPPYIRRQTQWSRQLEKTARKHMREGLLESFHVTIEKTCRCCKPEHGTSLEALARWQDDGHSLTPKGDVPGWDADNEFTDDTTISFDDKDEIGKDPEDLTNLPEALKAKEARLRSRDEFRSSEPPIRVVQAFCTACKPLAAEYNEIGKEIMEQRHYITRRLTEVDFLRQLIDNLFDDIETMNSTLANSPETREELNRMRERASSLQDSIKHTERQIAEARQRIITLEGRLEAKMVELKACEDSCQKETETQTQPASEPAVAAVAAETKEPKHNIIEPKYEFATPYVEFDNPADALDFKGWRQKGEHRQSLFPKPLETDCKPCVSLVEKYNEAINLLFYTRFLIVDAEEKLASLDEYYKWEIKKLKEEGDASTTMAANLLGRWAEAEQAMEQLLETLRNEEAMMVSHASKLIREIETCEKQCTSGTKTGLSLGDRKISESDALELPFPWDGPYSTACWRCEKLAAELNTLPPIARALLIGIKRSEAKIASIKANAKLRGNQSTYGSSMPDFEAQEYIRSLEYFIERNKDKLERVKRHFYTVKRMLEDCEKSCSPAAGAAIIQLEEAITVSGSNPFRADEIEELIEGESTDFTPPPPPPSTPTTPAPSVPQEPSEPEVPSEPEEPTAPALTVNTVGSISFAHTVGGSSCPQSAGTVTLSSNNGNPLSISNVSDTGTIASRLDQSVSGNNTASPQINASFNCSSAQNGTFTGNVTLTVTDTVTGESQNITIPATGTVSG